MSKLTSSKRNAMSAKSFAEPSKRKYPIEDKPHARNALARVAQHGTPAEKAEVKAKVKAKFPEISKKSEEPKVKYAKNDTRKGRLHDVETDRGRFRMKDNRKGE